MREAKAYGQHPVWKEESIIDNGFPHMVNCMGKSKKGVSMGMPDAPSKKKWDAANVKIISVKFFRKKDQDIIDFLEGKNKHDVIAAALREYMEKHS